MAAHAVDKVVGNSFINYACEDIFEPGRLRYCYLKTLEHLLVLDSKAEIHQFQLLVVDCLQHIPIPHQATAISLLHLSRTPQVAKVPVFIIGILFGKPLEIMKNPFRFVGRLRRLWATVKYMKLSKKLKADYDRNPNSCVLNYSQEGY